MGSDLHMSPPTPDEHRIVRCRETTAVYSRHTDGIYGDTRTWTRKHHIHDPSEAALKTLKATHPDWALVTRTDFEAAPETLSYEALMTPDRDFDRELALLDDQIASAHTRVSQATELLAELLVQKARLEAERK